VLLNLYRQQYGDIRLSSILLSIEQCPCLRMIASLFEHVVLYWDTLMFDMVMYKETLICFIPKRPASLGAPVGGSQNERDLGSCGPIIAPTSLYSSGSMKNMLCYFMFHSWVASFFYGQHFHLTGYLTLTLIYIYIYICLFVSDSSSTMSMFNYLRIIKGTRATPSSGHNVAGRRYSTATVRSLQQHM